MIAAFGLALLTLAMFGALAWMGVRAVRSAKRATVAAEILGGVFLLFGMGNMRDPSNDIVHQAKQLKNREDDDAGDPPNEERCFNLTPVNGGKTDPEAEFEG